MERWMDGQTAEPLLLGGCCLLSLRSLLLRPFLSSFPHTLSSLSLSDSPSLFVLSFLSQFVTRSWSWSWSWSWFIPIPIPRPGEVVRSCSGLMREEEHGEEELIGTLPDHILIEVFVRLPVDQWGSVASVSKRWAAIFRGEHLWQTAIACMWPTAVARKRWPGPIPRSSGRRRFMALYVCKNIIASGSENDELVGHAYLYLKEQLQLSRTPPPSSILHGTMIDQFIACGRSRDGAHKVVSEIWVAVINNLEENHHTFALLRHLAQEGDLFLPYPYSRSSEVLWRVYDKLFTDFRDCFSRTDYSNLLGFAKSRFQPLPSIWLGY